MIQICIVVGYVLLTIIIGIIAKKKTKSSRNYDGVGLGILLCVVVGAGEWLGGTSTVGVAEYGYEYGISGAWYTIANALGICVLAIFFAKKYRSMNVPTVSGIVGKFIGQKSRMASSGLQIFVLIAIGTSQMIAIGSIGETLFNINSSLAILILGSCILLYTVLGGMASTAYTNIMHITVMYLGTIIAVIVCMVSLPDGFSSLTDTLPESYFSMSGIGYDKVSSWIIASVLGACVAQAGLQPILGSKDEKTAVKSSYLIALIVAPFGILTALLGMISKYYFPELANAKMALPMLLSSINPVLGGFIMASIVAAVLSTASPIFLSCGTLFTRDIYLVIPSSMDKNKDDRKILFISRLTTFICGALCIVLAILLYSSNAALDIVYFAYSIRGSLFVILLFGIYWKGISETGANISMVVTALVGLFWIIYKNIFGEYPIHAQFSETYATVITSIVVTVVMSIICNKLKNKKEEKKTNGK